ncbi:hypothetical protein Sant_P0194 (plasmid) [Sodalis praecaptivus]|uniref:Uncharacterized protein n=1 Tax=Sodalis praecaptivus TaxID=1239307 RepID=W0HZP4_9GAMM|nr:hypothetical protein [Sodalis praecaptivus]AHF79239.1 hypothetical protein Sant_P0194 [Sodalis praecaptivus]
MTDNQYNKDSTKEEIGLARYFSGRMTVVEYTERESSAALNIAAKLQPVIRSGIKYSTYLGMLEAIKSAANKTDRSVDAIMKIYEDMQLREFDNIHSLEVKFNHFYHNILMYSSFANYLTSILEEAKRAMHTAVGQGDNFGVSLEKFIQRKMTGMIKDFVKIEPSEAQLTVINQLAHLARITAEKENDTINDYISDGQQQGLSKNAEKDVMPSSGIVAFVITTTALAVAASCLGAAAIESGGRPNEAVTNGLLKGAADLSETLRSRVFSSFDSEGTLQGIASIDHSSIENVASVNEMTRGGTEIMSINADHAVQVPAASDITEMDETDPTTAETTEGLDKVTLLQQLSQRLEQMRENVRAARELAASSVRDADAALDEMKTVLGRGVVRAENGNNTLRIKESFIDYATKTAKMERDVSMYKAELKMQKDLLLKINRLKGGILSELEEPDAVLSMSSSL